MCHEEVKVPLIVKSDPLRNFGDFTIRSRVKELNVCIIRLNNDSQILNYLFPIVLMCVYDVVCCVCCML